MHTHRVVGGTKIDPKVTSPRPEYIELSVETSRPLTSSRLEHLSAEITASKIDSINQRREAVSGQPLG